MKKEIVFATGNRNKINEIRKMLGEEYEILGLEEIGFKGEIPETGATFEENALQKAQFLFEKFGLACFAEDSGLEVDALGGAPGVFSARYAGIRKNDADNIKLLLENLENKTDRAARFRCAIAYFDGSAPRFFDGKVEGQIAHAPVGEGGFGYDPVFIPQNFDRTFGQFSLEEKNKISHRAQAVAGFIQFLKSRKS